ncbi:DHH family phosphoesterase [Halovivax gelatinilyticus]|uniref:DHH family phosphoesterase n=1 Tax=Halovivax gelatinilyticus TaxID=2961597 RepID=UPI0020CA8851|nr:bifunctional oligoribonuclease/PAP phosphatase NrnA [Halovivax gelatinilyticus]
MDRAETLAAALEPVDSVAIVCHDNPDPDCLASALAFERIANANGVSETTIVYGGEISHQQNRAFVNMLSIELVHGDDVSIGSDTFVVFVDHSRIGGNSTIDPETTPDAIIDHHPDGGLPASFVDVRPAYGATATIFVEYLTALDIELTERLATAILFAIHRERLDFVRSPTSAEYEAALIVYEHADLDGLEQLYGSAFTPETIDAIGRAILSRRQYGSAIVAGVGQTSETDALPQAADFLLNVEGVNTVLTYGIVGDSIRLSARSIDPRVNVGTLLTEAFDELGAAGGHHDMAGGRIDLGIFGEIGDHDDAETLLSFLNQRIERRFFDEI